MKSKRFHGKIGEEYNLFKLVCPHYEELQEKLAEKIKSFSNNKETKAIEIGFGSGYTTAIVLEKNPKIKIVAIDNEPTMIKQAEIVLKLFIDNKSVTLVESDALTYLKSLNKESFDILFSGLTLHNFKKEYRSFVIKEIYRVLKKRGLFINADKYALDSELKHKKDLDWQLEMMDREYTKTGRLDLKEGWTKHYLEDEKPEVILKEGESKKEMKEIGFNNVETIYRNHMEAILIARK